ncbi:MAG: hypothetical protein R3212_06280, partial [Xanthomonadales bacterium]|nr:hypothetical protein [Xanthomonadales bacterium]
MVEGPVGGKKLKRRTVRNLIIGGIAVVVILVGGIGGYYVMNIMAEKARQAAEEELKNMVSSLVTPYQEALEKSRGALESVAKDKAVIKLFADGDPAALEAAGSDRLKDIPAGLRLRFLAPGEYDLETGGDYALGFASIDLLRSIEKGKATPGAEVHKIGSDDEHVVMVTGVRNGDGKLVGLLYLAADVGLFKTPLESMNPGKGYAELRQTIAGKAV